MPLVTSSFICPFTSQGTGDCSAQICAAAVGTVSMLHHWTGGFTAVPESKITEMCHYNAKTWKKGSKKERNKF